MREKSQWDFTDGELVLPMVVARSVRVEPTRDQEDIKIASSAEYAVFTGNERLRGEPRISKVQFVDHVPHFGGKSREMRHLEGVCRELFGAVVDE